MRIFEASAVDYLLKPVSVDASNWNSVLVGSGYYKESQIK